jgi:iron(II)-dependent oxidoreductase
LSKGNLSDELTYFIKLSVFHEDMHTEAFTYTRQTLSYSEPMLEGLRESHEPAIENEAAGDIDVAGGVIQLGSERDSVFVFDNEKWAHPVVVDPFAISRTAVSQGQFAAFVDDGGYRRQELWSGEGWGWRVASAAEHPVYWNRNGDGWLRRHFDQWLPLEPEISMIHVNRFEAEAYCRWARRRLPTEAEWEYAAAADTTGRDSAGSLGKRHYPWGETSPDSTHANMDWQAMGPVGVSAHAAGDSPSGCRQLIGNVWEWTSTSFEPYPGFVVDPYKDYSRPCFGNCNVLRGGCWATRSRMIRNTWRNFYPPHRRDVFAGFRTCAEDL